MSNMEEKSMSQDTAVDWTNPLRDTVYFLWGFIHGSGGHEGDSAVCARDGCAQARSALGLEVDDTAEASPVIACPEGFHWLGQSGAWCDKCGLPSWEHDGMATARRPAGPMGEEPKWALEPWKPGERERMRERWEPDLIARREPRGHVHDPIECGCELTPADAVGVASAD